MRCDAMRCGATVAGCSCKLLDSRLTTGDVSRHTNIASAGGDSINETPRRWLEARA